MLLKVGSLGSCRINTPLAMAAKAGEIDHIQPGALVFTHNPLETIQGLRLLKREIPSPLPSIQKLTALGSVVDDEQSYEATLQKADLIVCELSSVRIVEYCNWQFQIHRFRNFVGNQGLPDPCHFQTGRSAALWLDGSAVKDDGADPFTRDLHKIGRCYEMSGDEIEAAVLRIIAMIGKPILFVCVSVKRPKSGTIKQRVDLRDGIARVAKQSNEVSLFDPTEFRTEYAYESVFRDMGHYADSFLPTVANRLVAEIDRLWHTVQTSRQGASRRTRPEAASDLFAP